MLFRNGTIGCVLFAFLLNLVLGEISFYRNTSTTNAVHSVFSIQLNSKNPILDDGKLVYITTVEPENACSAVEWAPKDRVSGDYEWFALVKYVMKADCSIKAKTVNLIAAGFDGAILFKEPSPSDPDAADEQKLEDEDDEDLDILLPTFMVTPKDSLEIKTQFTYDKGYLGLVGRPDEVTISTLPLMIIIVFGVIAVLLGLCICGALVRMLLNLNKN